MIKNPLENNHHFVHFVIKRIKRERGVQALPITPDILLQIKSVIDLSAPYCVTFWPTCVVAFFAFLRKSNL